MCQQRYHLAIGCVLNYSLFSDLLADYWNYIEFQWRLLEPAWFSGLLSLPSVKSPSWPARTAGAKAMGRVLPGMVAFHVWNPSEKLCSESKSSKTVMIKIQQKLVFWFSVAEVQVFSCGLLHAEVDAN